MFYNYAENSDKRILLSNHSEYCATVRDLGFNLREFQQTWSKLNNLEVK